MVLEGESFPFILAISIQSPNAPLAHSFCNFCLVAEDIDLGTAGESKLSSCSRFSNTTL